MTRHSANWDDKPREPLGSDFIGLLKEKAPRLALALAAGQMSWPGIKWLKSEIKTRRTFTIKVPGGPGSDDLYDEIHSWVLGLLPPGQQKALVAFAGNPRGQSPRRRVHWDDDEERYRERREQNLIRLRYDGSREQVISISGHRVKIVVSDGSPSNEKQAWRPPEIIFTASSQQGRDVILAEISQILRTSESRVRQPTFRILNQWDEWERADDLPTRSLSSVILPPGQAERLAADIERFLADEDKYIRRSVPWHRGHLYEGPPGTGKTSIARALACHFGLDVWYLPLADVKKDTSLIKLISSIKSRSVLLLEDVDVFHAATRRGDEIGGTTLSGLLNALDGIATPHGLITIMTTNEPDALDKALIRPGRVDLIEHFGPSGPAEIMRLAEHWYGEMPSAELPLGISLDAASVTEICKRHDGIHDAMREIVEAYAREGSLT